MSNISRIVNSIFPASNENNLSLATINFDFSLFQIEAPKEFRPLGSAIAKARRQDAEEGKPHQTARRLGALFEDVLPSFPRLVEAFGQRVSEIVQDPKINPAGTAADGCFRPFVGADGTTLWAAATSGIPAIGVYLLSCLLAQAWDPKEATALWVELVKQRQQEILSKLANNHIVSQSSVFCAKQHISREDLAIWDNSARSFIRSANQAKQRESDQLMLIAKNLPYPIRSSGSTYASVMFVWKEALVNLEALLSGTPVDASSGLLLLAFRSWYLFPDLIVLGDGAPKHVKFRDRLFPAGGRCTLGQERQIAHNLEGKGIQWSLTFSHLRYYGDPVVVQSNSNSSRVSFEEFSIAVLGHIFKKWGVAKRRPNDAAQWMVDLWNMISKSAQTADTKPRFLWLKVLAKAAQKILDTNPQHKEKNISILRFGRQRGDLFSVAPGEVLLPFFGLCSPIRLVALSQNNDIDCGIALLRGMAKDLGLRAEDTLICHVLEGFDHKTTTRVTTLQVTTAIPHMRQTKKRNANGEPLCEPVHARWLFSCDAENNPKFDWFRSECINQRSESRSFMQITSADTILNDTVFTWPIVPKMYSPGRKTPSSSCETSINEPCTCFEWETVHNHRSQSRFGTIFGDWRLALYVRATDDDFKGKVRRVRDICTKIPRTIPPGSPLKDYRLNPEMLSDYLSFVTRRADDDINEMKKVSSERDRWFEQNTPGIYLTGQPSLPIEFCKTLFTLELASIVYDHLEDATISLGASLTKPLSRSKWVPRPICEQLQLGKEHTNSVAKIPPMLTVPLNRQQAFSCVARFESGHVELDPEDLNSALALCSEDSLYVAAVVLVDPFEQPEAHELRRIVGNIGHPGISVLIAPEEPRMRQPSNEHTAISHVSYDFQRENNFSGTSLHLSFTDWRLPLEAGGDRTIDQGVFVVEAVISVLDRGKWVADLDILCIDFEMLSRIIKECDQHEREDHDLDYDYTSIDNWDELLDTPEGVGIFRAHGNWAARLAAVSILSQRGQGHSIGLFGAGNICFKCLEGATVDNVDYLMANESPLPSVCID